MRKKLYTLFLLTVLAIQILPIQQMGRMLFSNQFTEEIPHGSIDFDKDGCKKDVLKNDYLFTPAFSLGTAFISYTLWHPEMATAIPANHTGDIHVPPPNC